MTKAAAKENMQYYENLVSKYRNYISWYEYWINELEQLHAGLEALQNDFTEGRRCRKEKASSLLVMSDRVKSAGDFSEIMDSILNGYKYYEANNGLYEAKNTVKQRIDTYFSYIDDCRGYIGYCNEKIDYWYDQMQSAKE